MGRNVLIYCGIDWARRIDDKEACLAYVAVTRTRRRLDIGGLSWINEQPQGASAGPQPPQ
jgi:hypothetical protein